MASVTLGRVQLQIMQVLWDKGQATAREITSCISETEPIAHSTVQTMLRVLEEKGAVSHKADGRTFVFTPLVPEKDLKENVVHNLVERMFGGSVSKLLAHLIDSRGVSRREIDEIRKLIERPNKK